MSEAAKSVQAADHYEVQFLEGTNHSWTSDAMSFGTYEEAEQYGTDIMGSEMSTFIDYRVVLVKGEQPVA